MTADRFWAVIPAAGTGSRMQTDIPKQYLSLCGMTVLEHTLARFCDHPRITGVVVAIANEDRYWKNLAIAQDPKVLCVEGGAERMHSVLNGLRALERLAGSDDWVLVHDAARPCIEASDISRLMDEATVKHDGGLLGWPVRDTMKRVNMNNEVESTIDRTNLWHALTPQMFRLNDLTKAIQDVVDSGSVVTDEAQAMERLGFKPLFVRGAPDNIKITLKSDLDMAARYLHSRMNTKGTAKCG